MSTFVFEVSLKQRGYWCHQVTKEVRRLQQKTTAKPLLNQQTAADLFCARSAQEVACPSSV